MSTAVAAAPTGSASAAGSADALPPVPQTCTDDPDVAVFFSPRDPAPGGPLRVIVVSERALDGSLAVSVPGQPLAMTSEQRRGGPPFFWLAGTPQAKAGSYRATLQAPGVRVCADVTVGPPQNPRRSGGPRSVWPVEQPWSRATENLYSAWIEALFDAPLDEQPTWPVLHLVLRDPARNFLHDHLGYGEDGDEKRAPHIDPDCADLPYTLRAYFAFKLGLPFGYSRCTRGGGGMPPSCRRFYSSLGANEGVSAAVPRLGTFLRVTLANTVHSGTVRVPGDDDKSDFYPIALQSTALRPGAIFADPYGHILVVARRVPQTESSGGIMFAVDGQPDGTVSRRRYWRGNFLFNDDPKLGGPGFKRFRPVVVERGVTRQMRNREIASHPAYGDFSMEQYEVGIEGFYDRVDDVLSPRPIDPKRAFLETIQALDEQVRRRVLSVQNAIDYLKEHPAQIPMPRGAEIFITVGAWEDYSSPSRDMRLLIALDVVRKLPARVARRPERYAMPADQTTDQVKATLEELLRTEAGRRRFTYRRSDGSEWELSLATVIDRSAGFEMAYNPNDCPEKRWAAPAGSDELSTCSRHAPAAQTARMAEYRDWFVRRQRPEQ
ncbi:MAG: hypothetical protein JRI68_05660 [Deltaproteobacteria bacterium]|nr:hypothetical protein [Deltaproteobacteria bacterium]